MAGDHLESYFSVVREEDVSALFHCLPQRFLGSRRKQLRERIVQLRERDCHSVPIETTLAYGFSLGNRKPAR